MTNLLAWLAANLMVLGIALAFLIVLIAGVSWAVSWYFWTWVIQIERETKTTYWPEHWYGDLPHVPRQAVARDEAKRDAA